MSTAINDTTNTLDPTRFPIGSMSYQIYMMCSFIMASGCFIVVAFGLYRSLVCSPSSTKANQWFDVRHQVLCLCMLGNICLGSSWIEPRSLLTYDPLGTALFEIGNMILLLACLRTAYMFIIIHSRYHKPSQMVARVVAVLCMIFTCLVIVGSVLEAMLAKSGEVVAFEYSIGNDIMYGCGFLLDAALIVGANIYSNLVLRPAAQNGSNGSIGIGTVGQRDSRFRLLWLMRMVQVCCGLELVLIVLSYSAPNNWISIPINAIGIIGSFMICYVMGPQKLTRVTSLTVNVASQVTGTVTGTAVRTPIGGGPMGTVVINITSPTRPNRRFTT